MEIQDYDENSFIQSPENGEASRSRLVKLRCYTKALMLEVIQSKIQTMDYLSERLQQLLYPTLVRLNENELENERLKIRTKIQQIIEDLFDSFKHIQIMQMDMDVNDAIPSQDDLEELKGKLWREAFQSMEKATSP
jgi:exonuclease VII large subunit